MGLFPAFRKRRLKAVFRYDDRKGVGRVIADPPGLESEGGTAWACFPRSGKGGLKPCSATMIAKASERVIADPPGWECEGKGRGTAYFPCCGKGGEGDPSLATMIAKVSERVISPPFRAGNALEGPDLFPALRKKRREPRGRSRTNRFPVPRSTFLARDLCDTGATSLRKQNSTLPCKRPQTRGNSQGCELPAMRQGRRVGRAPRSPETRAYTVSVLCVVGTKCCVTQVPLCVVGTEHCVTQVPIPTTAFPHSIYSYLCLFSTVLHA